MRSLYDEAARLALDNAGAQKNHHAKVMIVSFWKIPAGGRRVFKHLTTSPIKKREKSSTRARWITFCAAVAARVGGARNCSRTGVCSRTHNVSWREPVRVSKNLFSCLRFGSIIAPPKRYAIIWARVSNAPWGEISSFSHALDALTRTIFKTAQGYDDFEKIKQESGKLWRGNAAGIFVHDLEMQGKL